MIETVVCITNSADWGKTCERERGTVFLPFSLAFFFLLHCANVVSSISKNCK